MSILPQLEDNKGTVSSALGKALAQQVLDGEPEILEEAVRFLSHGDKNVRAGAAKIIEQVAVQEPERVASYLPQLLPALEVPEPQTRWMVIHTLGLCAAANQESALQALPKAEQYLAQKSGACLRGATVIYLGHIGATSEENAQRAFPLLEWALEEIPGQRKQVLDAFLRLVERADEETRARMGQYAEAYAEDPKPSVRAAARRLRKRVYRARCRYTT